MVEPEFLYGHIACLFAQHCLGRNELARSQCATGASNGQSWTVHARNEEAFDHLLRAGRVLSRHVFDDILDHGENGRCDREVEAAFRQAGFEEMVKQLGRVPDEWNIRIGGPVVLGWESIQQMCAARSDRAKHLAFSDETPFECPGLQPSQIDVFIRQVCVFRVEGPGEVRIRNAMEVDRIQRLVALFQKIVGRSLAVQEDLAGRIQCVEGMQVETGVSIGGVFAGETGRHSGAIAGPFCDPACHGASTLKRAADQRLGTGRETSFRDIGAENLFKIAAGGSRPRRVATCSMTVLADRFGPGARPSERPLNTKCWKGSMPASATS